MRVAQIEHVPVPANFILQLHPTPPPASPLANTTLWRQQRQTQVHMIKNDVHLFCFVFVTVELENLKHLPTYST